MPEYASTTPRRLFMLFPCVIGLASSAATAAELGASEQYGRLQLHFEANRGQTREDVRFLARGPGYGLYLTAHEAVLVLARAKPDQDRAGRKIDANLKAEVAVLRMTIIGAAAQPQVSEREELVAKANYFIGHDPTLWRTNIPTYAQVHYRDVYPGIDLLYYGNQRELEYDFVVAPGADPQQIVLGFEGAEELTIDDQGALVLHTIAGKLRQRRPIVYQRIEGARHEIAGSYVLKSANRVAFQVAAYDRTQPLVIDPALSYATYLGGAGDDGALALAVDDDGNAYVTGWTASVNFPTTAGASQTTSNASDFFRDIFVAKLDPSGAALVYCTYLGGSGDDFANGIAVDNFGNVYLTGSTTSVSFPITAQAFQPTFAGTFLDAFVTKLNRTGSALVYSTYLGGSGIDEGRAIAVDAHGNAYIAGNTTSGSNGSTSFPVTPGAVQPTIRSSGDGFVAKLNPAGSALVYSTYLGGSGGTQAWGIAVDALSNAYVTGSTSSIDFPTTAGAFQSAFAGGGGFFRDAFVTKLDPYGSALVYSTYLGGSGDDLSSGIAVDAHGNAYVTGYTNSSNFPTTPRAVQLASAGGPFDAFVTKLNSLGSALVYSTYLGGGDYDIGYGIAVDAGGKAYVTGRTLSSNFPTTPCAAQSTFGGGLFDAFVAKLDRSGTRLLYSTYLGGGDADAGTGIAVDASDNIYVAGYTTSTNFPTTADTFQSPFAGTSDAFVAKIALRRHRCLGGSDAAE